MDAIEVSETIPVGIEKRDRIDLVDDGRFPPKPLCLTKRRVVGITTFEDDGGSRHAGYTGGPGRAGRASVRFGGMEIRLEHGGCASD